MFPFMFTPVVKQSQATDASLSNCRCSADRALGPHEKGVSSDRAGSSGSDCPNPDQPWDWHFDRSVGVVDLGSMYVNMPYIIHGWSGKVKSTLDLFNTFLIEVLVK